MVVIVFFYDSVYFIAFVIFLIGAGLSLRGIKPRGSMGVMIFGVLIDFFASVLPNSGFKSLAIGIGNNPAIITGITLGIVIWALFLAAVFVRLMDKTAFFFVLIGLIKVVWFVDIMFFMYGVYV